MSSLLVIPRTVPCWVGPCLHGMARPQVPVGGDGLQLWRIAANMINKQSRKADMGWPPGWGLVVALATPHHEK
jgi:hypothetical protein